VRRGTTEFTGGAWWLANFIAACDADATFGCEPDKIAIFDLHNYNCKASKWEDSGNFVELMKADLKSLLATTATTRSEESWSDWVNQRPVWVTETSCALRSNHHRPAHRSRPFCGAAATGTRPTRP